MQKRYFTQQEFNENFGNEMALAADVYAERKKTGMDDNALAVYDFIFISDSKDKLEELAVFLKANYNYTVNDIKKENDHWELTGDATEFPVDEENLIYWAIDLYCKGYVYDCKLDGYGAMADKDNQVFPPMDTALYGDYFEKAMNAYNNQNLGMAVIHFSTAIKIYPDDPNAWYSRAIAKDELYTWKAARRDYDKAIELAPHFVDALVNRASNKDDAGEYEAAIVDYTKAIEFDAENPVAYFNRGNSKFNKGDKNAACEDWKKAKELGADYAQERIDEHCK